MIKYSVLKNGIVTNQWTSEFAGPDYYEPSFGKPDRWLSDLPLSPLTDEEKALATNVLEVNDPILGFYKQYFFPAEYTIEIEDITEQVQQEKINADALQYLVSTDWYIIRAAENPDKPVPAEILLARQQARDSISR